jgi:dTDP-glucose 4,6-dehydratase
MQATPLPPLPLGDLAHARDLIGGSRWESLRGQRVFVTGGTGFIGRWLLCTLLDAEREFGLDCEVSVLSRDPAAFARAMPAIAASPHVRLVHGDVRSFSFPTGAFRAVIHAATDVVAKSRPVETFDTCVTGTRRVLDFALASGAEDVLLVSSGAVYGRQPFTMERIPEDYVGAPDPLAPASAYGEGKRAAEWLGCACAAEHGLRIKVARCFAFVGPHLALDKHFAIGNFLRDAMADEPIVIQGDGTPRRSYMHAADLAGWLWVILFAGRSAQAYNVGGLEVVSIEKLADRVVQVLGSRSTVARLQSPSDANPAEQYVPDIGKALRELDLPPPIALDEAIRRTAAWHMEARGPTRVAP